jgi:hypothetical protein
MTFEDSRLDALDLLTETQETLVDAPRDRTVEQGRSARNALSLIAAAKAELRKAAPVAALKHTKVA